MHSDNEDEECKDRECKQYFCDEVDQKDLDKNDDPFKIFGIGLMIFKNFLNDMPILFALITFLSLPILSLYRSGDGINQKLDVPT